LAPAGTAPDLLTVDLSTLTDLRAGALPVEVRLAPLGEQSNVASVVVHPTVTAISAAAGAVTVTVDLPVGTGQAAALSLLALGTGDRLRVFGVPPREADTTAVTVPVTAMAPGSYAVALSVDGAETALTRDAAGQVTGPSVTLT
jgi:hypothetical protein